LPGEPRDRLVIPVAAVVTLLWAIAGVVALVTAQVQVFLIVTGPFGVVIGYVFGVRLIHRAENGQEH